GGAAGPTTTAAAAAANVRAAADRHRDARLDTRDVHRHRARHRGTHRTAAVAAQIETRLLVADVWRGRRRQQVGQRGSEAVEKPAVNHSEGAFAAIGIRQPVPNARSVTFNTGAACLRLNSACRTRRSTRVTVSGSKPAAT